MHRKTHRWEKRDASISSLKESKGETQKPGFIADMKQKRISRDGSAFIAQISCEGQVFCQYLILSTCQLLYPRFNSKFPLQFDRSESTTGSPYWEWLLRTFKKNISQSCRTPYLRVSRIYEGSCLPKNLISEQSSIRFLVERELPLPAYPLFLRQQQFYLSEPGVRTDLARGLACTPERPLRLC